ncbi:signal peptidase I [Cellulomonas sp. HZM]|uniref:signal peptidase I n=1 Tax=Cellulomonas sp. HZM TaxID=1454010 RepID=UPI00068BD803|nr:signal peptidase I [Cellulomonas sp. HZM]
MTDADELDQHDLVAKDVTGDRGAGHAPRHAADPQRGRPARSGALSFLRETVIILVSALVLSLVVKTFLVQAFFIPSGSMNDTLIKNDRILVNKLAPGPFDLHRGDIVVFKDPNHWLSDEPEEPTSAAGTVLHDLLTWVGLYPNDAGEHLVKRVIGLPGDHVACAGPGKPVTVNGVALDEPYLKPGSEPSESAFDITVPADSLWVMGDNRQHSADSRWHQGEPGGGSVPVKNVVGVAFVIVWPADHWTVLRNPGATFAQVPDAS